ncbi:MAG TPA: DUF5343 domain-containing protein, partial [Ktedonobacteraceae bacterium]
MIDEQTSTVAPPYISFRTYLNLIDRLASAGIPQHLDRHYWKDFLSGSLGPQVMTALRFFGLITGTDNVPTSVLESLVEDKEHRKQIFTEMLQRYYKPVFDDNNLARATMGDLDKTFDKHYKLSVDTRRKSISFFLHAVQYVELPLSNHLKDASRTGSVAGKSTSRSNGKRPRPGGSKSTPGQPKTETPSAPPKTGNASSGNTKTVTFPKGGSVSLTYTVDLFDMDEDDRKFLLRLIDQLRHYEQGIEDEDYEDEELDEEEVE